MYHRDHNEPGSILRSDFQNIKFMDANENEVFSSWIKPDKT